MEQKHTIPIPDTLKPFVKSVWYLDGAAEKSFQAFADGNPGIVFQQRDTGFFTCENASKIPGGYVFGQPVKPFILNAPKDCAILGISLYPHVLQPIFRFSAKEITDGFVDLALLPPAPHIDLTEQLWELRDPQDQFRLIFSYLEYIIHKNKATPDSGLQYAVTRIMQRKGVVSLKQLQAELNLSERTFERKFDQHVGLSPMLLTGIAQFQAALQQLKSGRFFKLSDVAYDNGYADQSHFIRSFKKFTGVSPLQFQKQHLSELFYF